MAFYSKLPPLCEPEARLVDTLTLRDDIEAELSSILTRRNSITLVVFIERFAWRHALDLWTRLDVVCRQRFVPDGCELTEYGHRVLLYSFKTHLGNDRDFWQPLFEKIAPILRRTHHGMLDDSIWDQIIRLGMPHSGVIFREIYGIVGSHAGPFGKNPPDLYAMLP
ncbi:MAG: hypothetical protein COZ49_00940 [Candidatus Yonathbacteria bacterium CG_4_10_14_3_um_filter_47_65]|uniref:Uncharacterized protein n=2 Tax=Parcubacteria group TaxID=1794811 RepID=A0A2M8D6V9_9BACT|nr:MAG: hypothetical protein AUJ44_03400 [Candidatus Nomurabacteria bacterium CG1_02_47_685]PIP03219.1 MAG: hypothetical protein COX54_04410 [Candidatus Yonathbacteria bacterium CG23_combo_of_CG06-09_8_20_14_all_46_18]PIQ33078.1 MAG: hypothetical protein COW61_00415 [Candidatus Yonathbacteria bacterium CG17_big_fil_post_rev_8_21_14_2_50_46_19]PIX56642.1 MAG: hypothetical protein COZ49_00940 [Candidatus Yonathbacteria bacterium CG_4_10_14_3_um_filter_47_65]PIY57788.1 MAG: hypothetical protein CO